MRKWVNRLPYNRICCTKKGIPLERGNNWSTDEMTLTGRGLIIETG